ncbi:MAG: hypothetical protein RIE59_17530 [Imperialibacter sp.]
MKSKIAGELYPCEHDEDTFESRPIEIPYFENKAFKIGFVEASYEPYLKEADEVLGRFLRLNSLTRRENSQIIHEYYSEILKHGYCEKLELDSVSDIWKYVRPKEIVIDWEDDRKFYLIVSCGCAWEEEHGLQLVFKNGDRLTRASGHDGHFED